jgi:peptidoglycan/xylan/chitin deacetylase (PgdA/CDA1 family)
MTCTPSPSALRSAALTGCLVLLTGCSGVGSAPGNVTELAPIRFLLTFDDGPSAALSNNPTERIIAALANNETQPGVKAVFFVQTRWRGAGGSAVGQRLLRRIAAEGHVLGIHSGTERGHINHRTMSPPELHESLEKANADIDAVSRATSGLVRPTYWAFDRSTLATYERSGVSMLLTDLRARDGNRDGWGQVDAETGGRLHRDFRHYLNRLAAGKVAVVDGVAPVVVTFHDTNAYTASEMAVYLETLVRVAREAGMRVAEPPFYADYDSLLKAARARASNQATRADIAP